MLSVDMVQYKEPRIGVQRGQVKFRVQLTHYFQFFLQT